MFHRVLSLFVLAVLFPTLGAAQTPAPFPEFEAKRVRPPQPGARQRITIQVEEPQAPAATQVDPLEPTGGSAAQYGWFWEQVSPDLAASGPGRLGDAMEVLAGDLSVAAPRLQLLQDIAQEHGIAILTESIGTDVSPALILAIIAVESAGRADALSSAGAQGLMQLVPDTAQRFGVDDPLDAQQNIQGGVKYLNWLMEHFDGDPVLVLAGYNAGEGSIREHQGVPPFAETRDYVPKVLAAFQVARGLCLTPPELVTDGCVFRTMQ